LMDGQMGGLDIFDGWTDEWIDRFDGWSDGWTDNRTSRWMDR